MAPPEMVDGKFPVVRYNMGGSVMNLLVSLLFVPVLIVVPKGGFLALFSFLMIGMGIISGLGNGIPLHTKTVDNDGYNAISLGKSKDAMQAFWLQMPVSIFTIPTEFRYSRNRTRKERKNHGKKVHERK